MPDYEQLSFSLNPQPLVEMGDMPMIDRKFLQPLELKMLGRIGGLTGRTLNTARRLGSKMMLPEVHTVGPVYATSQVSAGLALILFGLVDDEEFDYLDALGIYVGPKSMTRTFISQHAHPALRKSAGDRMAQMIEKTYEDRDIALEQIR